MAYHRKKGFMLGPVEHYFILCTCACTLQSNLLEFCCLVFSVNSFPRAQRHLPVHAVAQLVAGKSPLGRVCSGVECHADEVIIRLCAGPFIFPMWTPGAVAQKDINLGQNFGHRISRCCAVVRCFRCTAGMVCRGSMGPNIGSVGLHEGQCGTPRAERGFPTYMPVGMTAP